MVYIYIYFVCFSCYIWGISTGNCVHSVFHRNPRVLRATDLVHTAGHLCPAACITQKHHTCYVISLANQVAFSRRVQSFVWVLVCFHSRRRFNTLQAQSSLLDLRTTLVYLQCSNVVIGPACQRRLSSDISSYPCPASTNASLYQRIF